MPSEKPAPELGMLIVRMSEKRWVVCKFGLGCMTYLNPFADCEDLTAAKRVASAMKAKLVKAHTWYRVRFSDKSWMIVSQQDDHYVPFAKQASDWSSNELMTELRKLDG